MVGSTSNKHASSQTPARSLLRKKRQTAAVVVMDDSSDSDCTPPPSVSPMKTRLSKKKRLRKKSDVNGATIQNEVIDLTHPRSLSPKPRKRRRGIDKSQLDESGIFINLCSDEEVVPPPRKRRKFMSPEEVISISSDDEAEVSRIVAFRAERRASPSLGQEEAPGHSPFPDIDPVTTDPTNINHNSAGASTHSPTSPPTTPENHSSGSVDTSEMTGSSIRKLSQDLLNSLYQEALRSLPSSSKECSLCSLSAMTPNQPCRGNADQPSKHEPLTPFFFYPAPRSLRKSGSRTKSYLGGPNALKVVIPTEVPLEQPSQLEFESVRHEELVQPGESVRPEESTQGDIPADDVILNRVPSVLLGQMGGTEESGTTLANTEVNEDTNTTSFVDESSAKDITPLVVTELRAHDISPYDAREIYCMEPTNAEAERNTGKDALGTFEEAIPSVSSNDAHLQSCETENVYIPESDPAPVPPCDMGLHPLFTSVESAVEDDGPRPLVTFSDDPPASQLTSGELLLDSNDNTPSDATQKSKRILSQTQTFSIEPSFFELNNLPNLTFQMLFASSNILGADKDLEISLPSYPD